MAPIYYKQLIKWTVLTVYSTFLVFSTTQSTFTLQVTFTLIFTLMTGATTQGANLLIRRKLTIHTSLAQQFWG